MAAAEDVAEEVEAAEAAHELVSIVAILITCHGSVRSPKKSEVVLVENNTVSSAEMLPGVLPKQAFVHFLNSLER